MGGVCVKQKNISEKTGPLKTNDPKPLKKLIISGPPASGKGTQCEIIKEKYGVIHLSTGDMLRAAVATDPTNPAKTFMDSGKLVPDDFIIKIVSFWEEIIFNIFKAGLYSTCNMILNG